MPPWCIHRVHGAWVLTAPNEWSQWIFSFKHEKGDGVRDRSAIVRLLQLKQLEGCRQWPWPREYHHRSSYRINPQRQRTAFHSLVTLLHACAFWYSADNLLKVGVRRSQGIVVPGRRQARNQRQQRTAPTKNEFSYSSSQ